MCPPFKETVLPPAPLTEEAVLALNLHDSPECWTPLDHPEQGRLRCRINAVA